MCCAYEQHPECTIASLQVQLQCYVVWSTLAWIDFQLIFSPCVQPKEIQPTPHHSLGYLPKLSMFLFNAIPADTIYGCASQIFMNGHAAMSYLANISLYIIRMGTGATLQPLQIHVACAYRHTCWNLAQEWRLPRIGLRSLLHLVLSCSWYLFIVLLQAVQRVCWSTALTKISSLAWENVDLQYFADIG